MCKRIKRLLHSTLFDSFYALKKSVKEILHELCYYDKICVVGNILCKCYLYSLLTPKTVNFEMNYSKINLCSMPYESILSIFFNYSFMERDYAPSNRTADPYAAAASSASRGYGGREQALAREPALPRETPRGRDAMPPRDYAPQQRAAPREYGEGRREEAGRDYGRSARGAFAEERGSASYSSRPYVPGKNTVVGA